MEQIKTISPLTNRVKGYKVKILISNLTPSNKNLLGDFNPSHTKETVDDVMELRRVQGAAAVFVKNVKDPVQLFLEASQLQSGITR